MAQTPRQTPEETFMHFASHGEKKMKAGDRAAAITAFLTALKIGSSNHRALSVVNSQLGTCYFHSGEYQLAAKYHEADVVITRQMKDPVGASSAYGNLGNTYKAMQKFEAAIVCFNNQLTLARTIKSWQAETRALTNIGNGYLALGLTFIDVDEPRANTNFNEALKTYLQVLDIAEKREDPLLTGKTYGCMGNAYDQLGSFDKAVLCHRKRVQICSDSNDLAGEGRAWCNLGNTYRAQGSVREAIDCYERDLAICERLDDKSGEATTCCNLALAYQAKGDFLRTKMFYERYIAVSTAIDDKASSASGYSSLGKIYEAVGRYDEAMSCFQTQLSIVEELRDENEIRVVTNTINAVRRKQVDGRLVTQDEAITALVAALEAAEARRPGTKKFVCEKYAYLFDPLARTMKGTISRVLGKLRPKARSQLDTEAATQFAILAQVKVQKPGQPSPDPEVALERPGSEGRPQRGSATLMLPSSGEPSRPTSPEERPTGEGRRATPDFLPAPRTVTDPQIDLKERKAPLILAEAPAPQVKMREKKKVVVLPPPEIEASAHEEPKTSSPKTQLQTKKFGFKAGINRLSSLFQRKGSNETASAVYLPDAFDNAAASRQSVMFPESFDANTPKVQRKQESTTPVTQRKQEPTTPVTQRTQQPTTPVTQRMQELTTPVTQRTQPPTTPVTQRTQQPTTPVTQRMPESSSEHLPISILSPVSPSSVPMFKGTSTPPQTKSSIYVDSSAQPEWSTVWAAPRNATEEQDRIRRRGEDLLQAIQALESIPLTTSVRAAEVARLPNPFNEQVNVNPLFDVAGESAPIRIKPPAGTFMLDSDEHTSC